MANQTTTIQKEWRKIPLKDVVDHIIDNRGRNPDHYVPKGIPVIDNVLIKGEREIDLDEARRFIDDDTYSSFIRKYNQENDVLITLVGNGYGNVALSPKEKSIIMQNTIGLRCNDWGDNVFLFYNLSFNKRSLTDLNIGAAQPSIKVGDLLNVELTIPPVTEQRAIAAVLSSLDDKIELLREQSKILEATAQAIFKEWFVDFNFPGATGKMIDSDLGKIPEKCRVGRIEDLCKKLASGGTPATGNKEYYGGDIDWFSTKELQDNFIFESDKKITKAGLESSSAKVFPKGSVVMAIYAAPTVGRLGVLGKNATFNQAACGFVANEEIAANEYIYLLLFSLRGDFNKLANGAAQQNLNVGLVKNFAVIIPDKTLMARFKTVIVPIFEKILNNTSQIQTISVLRDTLLPKLMKGEVRARGFENL